ncbi:hypothetical protein ACHWQZ_G004174 [Mnemiopsis leidyi]
MDILRTLGRGSRPIQGQNDILLSGIVCVTLNQKAPQPKFVEVTHNAVEKKTALYIHRTRDKRRTEAALDLTQATVFVENETTDVVGIINRDNRIYTLKLQKDKEDLERFVAQWRSVLTVSQHPDDMFSVITVSGEDRGSVILITAHDHESYVLFKHMSGLQKNSEFRLSQFVKLDKLSTHEVSLEARSGEIYHFISKRSDVLIRKLKKKLVEEDLTLSLPTKSHNNNTALYDSKQGYTPTFQQSREVSHVPADYLTMDQVNLPPPPPSPRLEHRAPPPRIPEFPDTRLPPPRSPGVPRRAVPPPPSRFPPGYSIPDTVQDGTRRSLEAPDYIPMDSRAGLEQGRGAPFGADPQSDYLSMDGMSLSNNPQDDYLSMDGMSLSNNPQDDYLTMDDQRFACDPPPPIPDYIPMDGPCGLPEGHGDYLHMDKGYHDPLIADYLSMDQLGNDQKFDSYPSHESREDFDPGFGDDEEEDIYFDPGLAPPPVPPRADDKPVPPPPRAEEKRPELPAKSSSLSGEVILERPLSPRLPNRGSHYSHYSQGFLQQPRYPPPLPRPTLYSDVQLRVRNSMSESSAPAPRLRRHSDMFLSTPPVPPSSYTEVELRPRPDISPSRLSTTPLPSRRISEQPHHLPRPRSTHLDGFSVEPALPPRTEKDQLRQKPAPPPVRKVEKRKKKKSSAVQQPSRTAEDVTNDYRGMPPPSSPPPPPPPMVNEHMEVERPGRPVRGPGHLGNGAAPPPLVPRKRK